MYQKRFLTSFANVIDFGSAKIKKSEPVLFAREFTGAKLNNRCIRSINGVSKPAIFPNKNQPIITPVKT